MRDGHLRDPENAAYSVAQLVWFEGEGLTPDMLVTAIGRAVADTEVLMTSAGTDEDGRWFLESRAGERVPTEVVDLSAEADPRGAAREYAYRDVRRPLPISGPGFPYRSVVLKLSEHSFGWFGTCHHMFLDGYGATLLRARAGQIIGALAAGEPVPESPLGSYADLVAQVPEPDPGDLAFWKDHLVGAPDVISPADDVAPPAPLYEMIDFRVPGFATRVAETLDGVNWAHVAAAAAIGYISVVLGQHGVVIGLPVTGRFTDIEKITPSQSMAALPLHLTVDHAGTVPDLVQNFRDTLRATRPHHRQAPEVLRAELPVAWRTGRMYGPMVNVIPFEMPSMAGALETGLEVVSHGPCDDLSFTVTPSTEDGIRVEMLFNPALYGTRERAAHTERFRRWVEQVSARPDAALADLVCLTEAEELTHRRLASAIGERSTTDPDWGHECTVADLAALAGVDGVTGLRLLTEVGHPTIFGSAGRVVVLTGSGARPTGLLASVDENGLRYRGPVEEQVVVNGRRVELGAVRAAVAGVPHTEGATITATSRRIVVTLDPGTGSVDTSLVTAAVAEVTSAPVSVR